VELPQASSPPPTAAARSTRRTICRTDRGPGRGRKYGRCFLGLVVAGGVEGELAEEFADLLVGGLGLPGHGSR
jgi:hypothetical protein